MRSTLAAAVLAAAARALVLPSAPPGALGSVPALAPAAATRRAAGAALLAAWPAAAARAACSGDECIMARRRAFVYRGTSLAVEQEFANSRSRSTGAGVWECAEVLASVLDSRPSLVAGRSVLELGAGCGLCAMVAGLCGARRVVATDGDPSACRHLAEVFSANAVALGARPPEAAPEPLKWEAATAASLAALGAPFDVVLGADLTYNPENAEALANALVAAADPATRVLLAHRRRRPEDDATIAALGAYFTVEPLEARGDITVLALAKRDGALRDLDLAARSAGNCNAGYVRRDGACILAG